MLAPLLPLAHVVLLLAGLLGPGAALAWALRVPATPATCLAGSAFALYGTVLTLDAAGLPISLLTLAGGLAAFTLAALAAAGLARRGEAPANAPRVAGEGWFAPFTGMGWWTPLYLVVWVLVLMRAWRDPLAGPDTEFRWSFLAEQMLRHGTLDFYPPVTAVDFTRYFWVESIPPGVGALHAWAYACAGKFSAVWTVPAVVLQLWALHDLLWRLASRLAGVDAARFACLAAMACPLLTWSFLLGQETGLTALSLLGIALSLTAWHRERALGWIALAGVFAVLGASVREYGLIFPALAFGGLVALRADRRAWGAFTPFLVVALAWPLRTLLLTGNPFYSLEFAGRPVNPRFVERIGGDFAAMRETLRTGEGWGLVLRYLLLYAPAAILGWIALARAAARRHQPALALLAAAALVLAVWMASVPFTNGGLFYSLRVMAPALAAGVLGLGLAFARAAGPGLKNAACALLAIALLPAMLALPLNPWTTPWREWPAFAAHAPVEDATVALVQRAAPEGVILADGAGFQRRFAGTGRHVIPTWSPQADFLFDRTLPAAEAARRWRASGIRVIVVAKLKVNFDYLDQRSRWHAPPFRLRLIGETPATAVYALAAGE